MTRVIDPQDSHRIAQELRDAKIEALERRATAAERLAAAAERRADAAERRTSSERQIAPPRLSTPSTARRVQPTSQGRHPVVNSDFPGVPTFIALCVIFAAIWPWMLWSHSGHEIGYLILSIFWSILVGIPIGIWAVSKMIKG
jgi:hypothetical protein